MASRTAVAMIAAGALAGCVGKFASTAPTPVQLPDGTKGYVLHCSAHDHDSGDCANQATHVCGGLYTVVDPQKSSTASPSAAASTGAAASGTPGDGAVVRCLPP